MRMQDIIHTVRNLLENDESHGRALERTGFWGTAGAGCVFLASDTGRFLLAHRSASVEQPHTWGTWGGAIDPGEDPSDAVRRELVEETGYDGPLEITPLYVFQKDTFRYSNFLAIVPTEFRPSLDWENQGYEWCNWGDWPAPLHFGLQGLLNDAASATTMQEVAAKAGGEDSAGRKT